MATPQLHRTRGHAAGWAGGGGPRCAEGRWAHEYRPKWWGKKQLQMSPSAHKTCLGYPVEHPVILHMQHCSCIHLQLDSVPKIHLGRESRQLISSEVTVKWFVPLLHQSILPGKPGRRQTAHLPCRPHATFHSLPPAQTPQPKHLGGRRGEGGPGSFCFRDLALQPR